MCRKTPKTLSGIETNGATSLETPLDSRKTPKTLSGIETLINQSSSNLHNLAEKHLKPYQGLKLTFAQLGISEYFSPKNT